MTFVSYPSLKVRSENGRFRVEISGTAADGFRDQENFVYRLFESDRLVWEYAAEKRGLDDYPHEAWVSNDGWVVVRTHNWFLAGILLLSPEGQVVLRQNHRRFLDEEGPGFLDSESEEYMGDSSAGPLWAQFAFGYFAEYAKRPYWTIRTWWGRRVVVDLGSAKVVEPIAIDQTTAKGLEIAWIQNTLASFIKKLEVEEENLKDEEFWLLATPVLTAAYHAGWLQATDSIEYLRRLETLGWVGATSSIGWARIHELPFRQVSKLSLLRMRQEPRWYPNYRFALPLHDEGNSNERYFDESQLPLQVNARDPGMLTPGLTQRETLMNIGAPDFMLRPHWEYDFLSGGRGLTARVSWDESHLENLPYEEYKITVERCPPRIAQVEIIEPQWSQITERDHWVV